jgi:ATP-binding cassette subfamily B protein
MTSSKHLRAFIWKFVRLQRWRFFLIGILSFTWAFDATLWPYLIRLVIDTFTQHDVDRAAAWPALKWLLLYGVTLWVVVESFFRAKDYLQALAFPALEADIRMAMFDHIQHHSPKYFNEHFAGSLSNKISDMTTHVGQILKNLSVFIPVVLTSILSILFFFQVNPLFALILSVWIVLHFSICLAFSPKCVKYSNIHGEARSSLGGKIVDSFTNNFAVNLFFRFRFERKRISIYQQDEQEKSVRAQMCVVRLFCCNSALFIVGGVVLNGFMVSSWLRGSISTGEVIQIFNTTWNMMFVLWFSGEIIPQFFQSIGIASQALTVMQDPQDVVDFAAAKDLFVKRGEIVFEDVCFQYGKKELFRKKNVHIEGGEKVGLVGYSGAGKSTFVNLILRFSPIESGRILIDGQDIKDVTLASLRHQVALIPQDPLLFHRSLMDNIRYGREGASKEEVISAAKLAHCDEFITKCPDGYDSLVGERGTKLSGGERQRIAIARAMLASAPILILDEATSALDSVTEGYIQDSLEKLMQDRTTLVIAHRLSTLSKMDRILVFDQGKIVEQGSHQELMETGGHYARMWQMQAGGFLPDSEESEEV